MDQAFELTSLRQELERARRELTALQMLSTQAVNERASLLAALEQRDLELHAILEVIAAAADSENLAACLERVLGHLMELTAMEGAEIYLLEKERQMLTLAGSSGLLRALSASPRPLALGEGLPGATAESEQPLVVERPSQDPRVVREEIRQLNLHLYVGIPLRWHGQTVGCLGLVTRRRQEFPPGRLALLTSLSSSLGVVLANARLLYEERQKASYLQVLDGIARTLSSTLDVQAIFPRFLQYLRSILEFERAFLMVVERETGRVLFRAAEPALPGPNAPGGVVALEEAVVPLLLESRHPLLVEDLAIAISHPSLERAAAAGLRSLLLLPLISADEVKGGLLLSSTKPRLYRPEQLTLLEPILSHLSSALESMLLTEQLEQRRQRVESAFVGAEERARLLEESQQRLQAASVETAHILVRMVEERLPTMRGNADRVGLMVRRLAWAMGMEPSEQERAELAAHLRDIGYVTLPDSILGKAGRLEAWEMAQVQLHPTRAVELLSLMGSFRETLPLIEAHHERWDGLGYPRALRGQAIPLGARAIAIADAFVAMTSERPHRPALSEGEALARLEEGAGRQWDPDLVRTFVQIFRETEEADLL